MALISKNTKINTKINNLSKQQRQRIKNICIEIDDYFYDQKYLAKDKAEMRDFFNQYIIDENDSAREVINNMDNLLDKLDQDGKIPEFNDIRTNDEYDYIYSFIDLDAKMVSGIIYKRSFDKIFDLAIETIGYISQKNT